MGGAQHTTGGTDLDVQSVDAELLAAGGDVLGSQHGSVGGGLVTVSLDLHTTGDTGDGFTAGQIGDVDEGVVEGGEDTSNAEDELACCAIVSKSVVNFAIFFTPPQFLTWEFRGSLRKTIKNSPKQLFRRGLVQNVPSRAEGPREMFSLGAATFLGGILRNLSTSGYSSRGC